jgi:hypothetical protein
MNNDQAGKSGEAMFTKGPWDAVNGTDIFTALGAVNAAGVKADDNDGWQVADCDVSATFVDGHLTVLSLDEKRANAALIAAAPELYEALSAALLVLGGQDMTKQSLISALESGTAALAKARGEK